MKTRTCRFPGCSASWVVSPKAGRPRVWCAEHATTALASRRNRAQPQRPKPDCCPTRGLCEQHKQAPGKQYLNNAKSTWNRNGQTLADFVDVFGHCQILSDTGHPIYRLVPPDDDED